VVAGERLVGGREWYGGRVTTWDQKVPSLIPG